jgi:DNA invertase Pin-like site-specific DNA recombinase
METSLVRAAQYLRMSTAHQQYSLQNQADAIARYAVQHGFAIVKTYSDAARSGLQLKNRAGLKQLLKDVMEGQFDFHAVLVYDVSRWDAFKIRMKRPIMNTSASLLEFPSAIAPRCLPTTTAWPG